MNEALLKQKIGDWLTGNRLFFRRFAGSPYSRSGIPDFFVLLPGGRTVWIEVKRPGRYKDPWAGCKKDSPAQYNFLFNVNSQGGIGLCVDSLDEVATVLSPYLL